VQVRKAVNITKLRQRLREKHASFSSRYDRWGATERWYRFIFHV